MQNNGKSTIALIIALLYLLLVAASFVIMPATRGDTALSGIFLVLVTPPWSLLLGAIQKFLRMDSSLVAGLILLAGGGVNSYILYRIISCIAPRLKGGNNE